MLQAHARGLYQQAHRATGIVAVALLLPALLLLEQTLLRQAINVGRLGAQINQTRLNHGRPRIAPMLIEQIHVGAADQIGALLQSGKAHIDKRQQMQKRAALAVGGIAVDAQLRIFRQGVAEFVALRFQHRQDLVHQRRHRRRFHHLPQLVAT